VGDRGGRDDQALDLLVEQGPDRPLLEVQASYLQAGFAQVTASYGSMYGYAVHGLGLSPQTITKLRHKLLVG